MFVIASIGRMDKVTGEMVGHLNHISNHETLRGAKMSLAALNRKNRHNNIYRIMTNAEYNERNTTVVVTNLLSGKPATIDKDQVGGCCDPSTERYWSM
jgi:uncharacterized protein (UPF0297 family)